MKIKKTAVFFSLLIFALLHVSKIALCQTNSSRKDADTMLCVGYHWKEAQGKEFLEQMRKT